MKQIERLETTFFNFLQDRLEYILAATLAVIYVWFGGLKLFGMSPANSLLYDTLPIFRYDNSIFILGLFEVILGISFLSRKLTRIAYPVFLAHMCGTFVPFLTAYSITNSDSPVNLTLEGQYIIKNFALIASATALWYLRYSRNK